MPHVDGTFLVVCRSDRPDSGRFAIAHATAPLANAREFCPAVARMLD